MGTNANSGRRGGALDKVFYCAQHACAVLALRQNDVVMAAHFLRQPRENDAAQRLQQQHAALGNAAANDKLFRVQHDKYVCQGAAKAAQPVLVFYYQVTGEKCFNGLSSYSQR